MKKSFHKNSITKTILSALSEDRIHNDISTKAIWDYEKPGNAIIISRQNGILCGMEIAKMTFEITDKNIKTSCKFRDGMKISSGDIILKLRGTKSGILRGERTALNFLSHLSGISTLTNKFVDHLEGSTTRLLDTRKTLPGLRDLEKYAVSKGGGNNHRRDLSDMYLLKENHIAAAGGIEKAIQAAILHRKRVTSRRKSGVPKIEIEVRNLTELKKALQFDIDRIMLDNFSPAMADKAVKISRGLLKRRKHIELEVSGGINLKNIKKYALTGVDFISVGALTHSAPSFDFSLSMD